MIGNERVTADPDEQDHCRGRGRHVQQAAPEVQHSGQQADMQPGDRQQMHRAAFNECCINLVRHAGAVAEQQRRSDGDAPGLQMLAEDLPAFLPQPVAPPRDAVPHPVAGLQPLDGVGVVCPHQAIDASIA